MKSFADLASHLISAQDRSAWAYARAMRLRDGGNGRYNLELATLWQGYAAENSLATRKLLGIE